MRSGPDPWDDMGVASAEPLWRAIAVYRFASIGYAVLLAVINRADYSRPGWAWVVIAAMTAWTAVTTVAYAHPERRSCPPGSAGPEPCCHPAARPGRAAPR